MGWSRLDNGELLNAAETQFDAFITTDQNLRYQQELALSCVAILVLPTTSWPRIQTNIAHLVAAVDGLRSGDRCELTFSI
jgi:hypothetical protein